MILIKKENDIKKVSMGAFIEQYEDMGYEIVSENKEVQEQPKVVVEEEIKVEEHKDDKVEEKVEVEEEKTPAIDKKPSKSERGSKK